MYVNFCVHLCVKNNKLVDKNSKLNKKISCSITTQINNYIPQRFKTMVT